MKTKTVLCALALIAVFTACGGYDKETDFEVSPAEDGKSVVITDYDGEKLNVKIPPRIQKMPVTGIGDYAFRGEKIISVAIPKGVTSIDYGAFYNCTSIASITIPSSVTSIGRSAFLNCIGVTSITIPKGVTEIGEDAFSSWEAKQTINVQGYANQAAADAAWGKDWRSDCEAVIKYQGK